MVNSFNEGLFNVVILSGEKLVKSQTVQGKLPATGSDIWSFDEC